MRGNFHYNYATGRPCYCGWGRRDHGDGGLVPKVAGWQDEWQAIRGRKKLQRPEMQEVLDHLDQINTYRTPFVNEDTVKWVPWILQKLKNKELNFGQIPGVRHPRQPGLHYPHPEGLYGVYPDRHNVLAQPQFQKTAEFLNSGHRLRREIDPLKTSPQEMHDRVLNWERDLQDQKKKEHRKTGTVVHAYPDGWTMRELAPHELEGEGVAMGSCVGSYPDSVENGDMRVLSLRDPKGEPHVTSGTRHEYVDHPPGYLYEHKGVGNAEPKEEYNDRFRQYWGQFPPHERPLSYDWEEGMDEPEDYHDLSTLLNRENQGEPELDDLGLPRQPPDGGGIPHLDLEDWHDRLTDDGYGGYRPSYRESNGRTLMNYLVSTGRVPEYEHQVLYPAEERVYDDAIDNAYANSGGGPYHPEYEFTGPWATQPDFWEERDWGEFMRRHELEDSEEERTKIRDEYEEAEQEQNDAALREDPRYQATSHMFGLVNDYNTQQAQLQQQQQRQQQQPQQVMGAKHDVTHPHFWYGYPCRCPWGHEDGGEHLGAVKEAAKLDWLRERKDMQDEAGKGFLNKLEETGYDDADKMLPWIIREWRKNRLSFEHAGTHHLTYLPSDAQCGYCDRPLGQPHARFCSHNPQGSQAGPVQADQAMVEYLTPKHAEEWLDTLKSMKNHRQGVDLMQHSVQELAPKIKAHQELIEQKKREKAGRVTHRFDDGWTVRQLQNREEAKWEGNEQGNCVGSYGTDIENGDTILMSLRTPDNRPRATMEIRPGYWFDPKEPAGEDNHWSRYDRMTYMHEHPDRKLLPHPEGGSVSQWYGRSNGTPDSEHSDRMREWLDQYGNVDTGTWLDGEQDPEEEEFEPWWHDTYEAPGPDTPGEYINYHEGADHPEGPDEYYNALADAEEHGLEGPELEYGDPAFDSIWENHVQPGRYQYMGQGRHQFDPEEAEDLASTAKAQGHLGQFHHEWTMWNNDPSPVSEWEPHYQDAYNWWNNEFKNHINPDTGGFEDPIFRGHGQPGGASWETALDRWWQRTQPAYPQLPGMEWQGEGEQQPVPAFQQSMFSRYAAANPPIYYRWALSPETGDVELGSNLDDHPALVPGHEELAGRINRPNLAHGYAYRIKGGWRLTDWESQPVKDRFTTTQIMRALANKDPATPSEDPQEPDWGPASYDFDRTHHGVPQPAGD